MTYTVSGGALNSTQTKPKLKRDSEWQWHQLGICKSAPRYRQITTPAPHHSVFYRPDALPAAQPTASKHWRQTNTPVIKPIHVICKNKSNNRILWSDFSFKAIHLIHCFTLVVSYNNLPTSSLNGDCHWHTTTTYYTHLMASFPGQPG